MDIAKADIKSLWRQTAWKAVKCATEEEEEEEEVKGSKILMDQ